MEDQVTEFLSRGATSILVSEILQYAKEWKKLPFLSDENRRNNFLAGILGSVLSAEGVHWALNSETNMLSFTIPVDSLPHAMWDGAKSWAMQQAYWRLAIKKKSIVRKETSVTAGPAVEIVTDTKPRV